MRLVILCTIVLTASLYANINTLIRNELKNHNYDTTTVGFLLLDSQGKTLASLNKDKNFILASVQKLFTGAAAMDMLDPLHNFKTEVYCDSLDKVSGKVIGNLYIKGYGDPGFTAERLWLLTTHLKHQGIKEISDTLFLDNSYFDTQFNGPGFSDKKSSRAYMAPVSPLSTNFNAVAIHILPTQAGSDARIELLPDRANKTIRGSIKTIADNQTSGLEVATYDNGTQTVVNVSGTINSSDDSRYIYRKVWEPIENFGTTFKATCQQVGIECNAIVKSKKIDTSKREIFYRFDSKPLHEHIYAMFKYSNNFIAEMIFKTLAAEKSGTAGSWDNGVQVVSNWYKNICKDTTNLPSFVNGSGMGSNNKGSATQISNLLNYANTKGEWRYEFISGLPVAGKDGTLQSRFKKTPLVGILRAKTGTLNSSGVANVAGYIITPKETLTFALLINNTSKGQYNHWQLQEAILTAAYKSYMNL